MGRTATYQVYVDWDNDGNFTGTYDDISAVVQHITIERGRDSQLGHAQAGTCEIVVKDTNGMYSPENILSDLYPNIRPKRPVYVTATYDTGGAPIIKPFFTGFISKIIPHPHWDKQNCYIYCLDGMDNLQKNVISPPVVLPYEGLITGEDTYSIAHNTIWLAQSFTATSAQYLTGVSLRIYKVNAIQTVTIRIRATDVNGKPTGSDLAAVVLDNSLITTDSGGEWYDVTFSPVTLVKDTVYSILLNESANVSVYVAWLRCSAGGYTGGSAWSSADSGSTWAAVDGDFMFKAKYITS